MWCLITTAQLVIRTQLFFQDLQPMTAIEFFRFQQRRLTYLLILMLACSESSGMFVMVA